MHLNLVTQNTAFKYSQFELVQKLTPVCPNNLQSTTTKSLAHLLSHQDKCKDVCVCHIFIRTSLFVCVYRIEIDA